MWHLKETKENVYATELGQIWCFKAFISAITEMHKILEQINLINMNTELYKEL